MGARPLSEIEYSSVAEFLGTAGRHRDKLLLVLGCATGFRNTELLSLRWEQVWDGKAPRHEVVVARRNLKGGAGLFARSLKSRRVPLNESARATIVELAAAAPVPASLQECVFATSRSKGGAVGRSRAFRIIVRAAVACGIEAERISTHTLRKTFVARVYAARIGRLPREKVSQWPERQAPF